MFDEILFTNLQLPIVYAFMVGFWGDMLCVAISVRDSHAEGPYACS